MFPKSDPRLWDDSVTNCLCLVIPPNSNTSSYLSHRATNRQIWFHLWWELRIDTEFHLKAVKCVFFFIVDKLENSSYLKIGHHYSTLQACWLIPPEHGSVIGCSWFNLNFHNLIQRTLISVFEFYLCWPRIRQLIKTWPKPDLIHEIIQSDVAMRWGEKRQL